MGTSWEGFDRSLLVAEHRGIGDPGRSTEGSLSMGTEPFAPEQAAWYLGDPDAAFRRLRAEDPLHWYEGGGFWCVTKHADVQQVSQHPRVFSSTRGTQLFEVRHGEPDFPAPSSRGAASIIRMDPPHHNRHRKLVIGAFTPGRIAQMEGWIRAIAVESLEVLDPSGSVEFVDQIAVPMPMFVIAELLGIPREDHATFRRWSDHMVEAGGGNFGPETGQVIGELVEYVSAVTSKRRRRPCEDLISRLVEAELEGERLSDDEIASFCLTLLVAGNETTRNLVAGGALALMQHPEQRDRLAAKPDLIPEAVEEMLRWVTPVRNFVRCAAEDTELRGKTIRRGDYLALFYSSANRDEEVFGEDAESFDISRASARRHLSFGFGEHLCLGAALARLEGRVLFEELFRRWPRFELAGEPEPLHSCLMNGLVRMPVALS
jgi:cytochrome P450